MDELFRRDPNGAMLAFESMIRKQIVMPAHMMSDGSHESVNNGRNLFSDYSAVADTIGVYTAFDYANIMENLAKRWDIKNTVGLDASGMAAQEFLCSMPDRIRKLATRSTGRRQ